MSDTEEQKSCQTCSDFEPQTWRKSLCKNCFHTLEEHSADILANEANAVAKEKAEAKSSEKVTEASTVQPSVKPKAKNVDDSSVPEGRVATGRDDTKKTEDKESESATLKRKYGAARCAGEKDSAWSWAKDLGCGYTKSAKPDSQDTSKGTKGSTTDPPIVPSTGNAASAKSSPTTTAKPSLKSTTASTGVPTSETPSPALSSSSATTTTSPVTADTSTASVSKAKSFASKFESKATALSSSKSMSKPKDIRPGSANVAALTGKLTDTTPGSKTKAKLPPEKVDESQQVHKQPDTKAPENVKNTETLQKLQKTDSVKAKDGVSVESKKDSKQCSDHSKDKLSEKTSLSVGSPSKTAPFGQDVLKSRKDSLKRDNISVESVDKKAVSPQIEHEETRKDTNKSHSAKSVSEKISENKNTKHYSELATTSTTNTDISQNNRNTVNNTTVSSLSTPPDSKLAAGGTVNNRQIAKITGRSVEGEKLENSETKDYIDATKDSGGDACEGRISKVETNVSPSKPIGVGRESVEKKGITEDDKKNESSTSVSSTDASKGEKPPLSTSTALKPTNAKASSVDSTSSSYSSQSKTVEANKSQDIQPESLIDSTSVQGPPGRTQDLDEDNNEHNEHRTSLTLAESAPSSPSQPALENNVEASDKQKTNERDRDADTKDNIKKLNEQLKEKDEALSALNKQLSKMEEQVKMLEAERDRLQKESLQAQKDDMEKLLKDLRLQLSKMEEQCTRLDKDNQALIDKLHLQEASVKRDQESRGKTSDNVDLEEDLEAAEQELEEVKEENKELQRLIMEMKNEMDEMYDHFREHDHDEFREIQKELDMTAKNCRILQFKLRKAERRNDQIEQDRIQYEEKLRRLQDQFDSQDAKDHIRLLEEELRMAKEVSVRLHDELDVVEDKRNKALEENKHLTELLEHTDKRQFRLEMEIDKLRDIVADLKQQLKEAKAGNNNNKDSTPDRKPPLAAIGKQGSREYDVSQLMKDLYDSMERENDLKDQLKFSEEEAKMMRRRVSEMDEENENLRLQLQKMSEKATKHKKKEKERTKELVEERSKSDAIRAALSAQNSQDDDIADVILIVGPEGSDLMNSDEPIPVSQRKDSTDEDLMNVMQMRVHLEMLEQELMTSHKKLDEMDLENENLQAEVKFLQERLAEKEVNSGLPEPSTPNAYYEDKLREMTQEADELRWKLIEKDREMERLTAVHTRHSREHSHKKCEKLKKSKSLEETDVVQVDPRKQLEHAQMEIARLKKTIEELTQANEDLRAENEEYKNRTPVPSVHADDAAVENIELKENLRRLEETNRGQAEKIKTLSDSLQKLTRDTRSYTSIATSPTVPGTLSIPGIPLVGPGTQTARAGLELSNPTDDSNTRDLRAQLHVLQRENEELRRSMEELGVSGEESRDNTVAGKICDSKRKPATISPVSWDSKTQREKESKTVSIEAEVVSRNIEKTVCDKQTELNAGGIQLANQVTGPSAFDSCQSNMEYKKDSTKSSSPKASTTSAKDGGGKTKDTEEEAKERVTTSAAQDVSKVSKEVTKDEPLRPISLDYPEGKSKVLISGSESRVELMEKVLEMDEEISDLIAIVRRREDESDRLKREVKYLNSQLRELRDESRRMEMDLLQELDMLHDKNSVMSNLLDIINERAEAAEEELERRMQEETTHSPVRSTSNVSQVSALSDTSMGSDEVFLNAQFNKEGVITRDWEAKLKVRIESLERLLAEERQKVTMAEKKLMLAGIDSVSPSVSDDVKLRLREKELLQEELLKSQRHLHIATDQIQGLKERIHILEDEHERLKKDYARLYEEIDKPLEKEHEVSTDTCLSSSDKKNFQQVRSAGLETNGTGKELCKLEEELQKYKQRATELEYKVEEIDDIWRSKSAASDKDRNELEQQLNQKIKEHHVLEQTLNNLKNELCSKDKIIAEINTALKDKSTELSRIAETMKDREGENKKHEQEQQGMLAQISQRDVTIRNLNETIRIRDERLREKDDILFKLNTSIDEHKREMIAVTEKLNKMAGQLKENDAEISVLRGQLSSTSVAGRDVPRSCQTDAEKEGFRLKETVKKLQRELDKVMGDKRALETNLEKSRKSLEEAMMMWDKDRHSLQKDANILEEKVRMYEAFNSMNRDETIETLKNEAQGYFSEKEALLCELSSEKLQHEADGRMHREQQAKLQTELTEKLRLLKTEVDSNSHMTTEMNRLKRQAEMAYRLQQEQRVFKAEHLAMKVRYETRIDKMSKEHNKMLLTIDKLQKERDMDKQIIDGIQKNFNLVKDSYTEELLRSQEDKAALRRYVKEIEESRIHLDELQRHVRDLRDKTVDQDRLRADLINKFATDRSSWEIERANLVSQVNQLEEKIFSSSRQQERSKDIQVNMGMAWEKERREQRRLLAEAHTLALDLQEQLRSRDEAFAHERKELLHQMENDRINLTKDKRDIERKIMEFESVSRKVIALEKRLKDVQDKHEKDLEEWQKERRDLLRAAAEARHAQVRDAKMLENILSKLIRLRELGTMLTSQHKWDSLEEKPPDRPENIEQSIIDYVKEAALQVSQVADELTLVINPTPDEEAIKRISNSEIDLLKEEFSRLHHEADDVVVVADVTTSSTTTTTRIQEEASGTSRKLPKNSATSFTSNQPRDTAFLETVTKSNAFTVTSSPQGNTDSPTSSHSPSTTQIPTPVVLRPPDATSRQYDRPPSYTSGTRSAQTSRAATPEVPDIPRTSILAVPSRKSGFPEPPPSFVIPHHSSFQTQKQQSIPTLSAAPRYSSTDKSPPKRPVIFMKSLSMDSGTILDNDLSEHLTSSQVTSISASNTPTQPVTSADLASYFATPSVITSSGDHLRSAARELAPRTSHSLPRTGKCSPRTARRQFFESYPTSASLLSNPIGYQSWPERRHVPPAVHTRQTSLPDPEEVRKEAEEEHDLVSSKLESKGKYSVMKSSTSWDEQMHRKEIAHKTSASFQEGALTFPMQANLLTVPDDQQTGSRPASAKEKRKLFKKAISLDSTVGSSIAKVGVAAMPLGAPTGFTPSELFATVKGKLKPVFKKKSADSGSKGHEPRSPSPLFIQTDVPDIHFAARGSTSLPVPVPHVDVTLLDHDIQAEPDKSPSDIPDERSRDSSRNDIPRGKWRSKSADRAQGATGVHADVIRTQPGVWKFNETAV